ncbi:hypothetical protein AMAG_13204 [Allomyces macrogynus ATCC 38327]|uniref:Uncharacterized protein n=1 Tax=Allomyces macrogynus (strain ATCC 38327) TaxID=578462 RepID=A0A0L0SZW2_ALLM3|nr:hypothetical protein AMAG_13204 [Allomyces macrogynus ATCC 38327]|eukprot:KNE68032.1 hypothetical protein AMAG_13204 [Allomyces macrogynus ATCC 38327]
MPAALAIDSTALPDNPDRRQTPTMPVAVPPPPSPLVPDSTDDTNPSASLKSLARTVASGAADARTLLTPLVVRSPYLVRTSRVALHGVRAATRHLSRAVQWDDPVAAVALLLAWIGTCAAAPTLAVVVPHTAVLGVLALTYPGPTGDGEGGWHRRRRRVPEQDDDDGNGDPRVPAPADTENLATSLTARARTFTSAPEWRVTLYDVSWLAAQFQSILRSARTPVDLATWRDPAATKRAAAAIAATFPAWLFLNWLLPLHLAVCVAGAVPLCWHAPRAFGSADGSEPVPLVTTPLMIRAGAWPARQRAPDAQPGLTLTVQFAVFKVDRFRVWGGYSPALDRHDREMLAGITLYSARYAVEVPLDGHLLDADAPGLPDSSAVEAMNAAVCAHVGVPTVWGLVQEGDEEPWLARVADVEWRWVEEDEERAWVETGDWEYWSGAIDADGRPVWEEGKKVWPVPELRRRRYVREAVCHVFMK